MLPEGTATLTSPIPLVKFRVGVMCAARRHCDNPSRTLLQSHRRRSYVCCQKALRLVRVSDIDLHQCRS